MTRVRRVLTILGAAAVLAAAPVRAGQGRILERELPSEGVERVAIDAGVGDVTVTATGGDAIRVRVELEPRRSGIPFFGTSREGREQVAAAELRVERTGGTLELRVRGPRERRRFRERWTVELPAGLGLDLDLGVGDVEVRGVAGGVRLDLGVGDATVEVADGDVDADLGVGDLEITAPLAAVGAVDGGTGVGEARLHLPERSVEGRGTVSKRVSWTGDGPGRVSADVGVGDVVVTLTAGD